MAADTSPPIDLLQHAGRMVGMIAALSVALRIAVKANPDAAGLRGKIAGVRQAAQDDLGRFDGPWGMDGIETVMRDFERLLRGDFGTAPPGSVGIRPPRDQLDSICGLVGTVSGLMIALRLVVETNPRAIELRTRTDVIREAAIAQVIGEDVVDDFFDGIDYAMGELDAMLPDSIDE